MSGRALPLAALAALVLLLVGPVATVALRSLATVPISPETAVRLTPTLWRDTALITAAATAVAVGLGLLLAAWVAQIRRPGFQAAAAIAGAFPLAVPMYLHGMAAWQMALLLGLYAERPTEGPLSDLLVIGLVQGVRLASLVFLLVLAGWQTLDARWLEAGLLAGSRRWVRRRLLWPLLAPFAALGALLAAVISATDVAVPLLFQRHSVVALRLWDAHYRALDPAAAWRAIIAPAAGLTLVLAALLPALWRRAAPLVTVRRDPSLIPRPAVSRVALGLGGVLALLAANASLIHLLRQVTDPRLLAETFRANAELITATIATALGAAAVALAAGLCLAPWMRVGGAVAALALVGGAIVFAVPGFLWSAGAVTWWSQPGWRGAVYDTGAVRWLTLGGRLALIPALLLGLALARAGRGQIEAARVAGLSRWATLRSVVWPPLRRPAWVAYALVTLAVAGDLDAAILMDLPGRTTLVVGLCNRLHISPRSPEVAMMAVVILTTILGLLAAPLILGAATRARRSES